MATQYAFSKIVTDGLVLSLNAADRNSYPGSGTTWTDMSGNGNNGTLTNGPTFNSANGGAIVFDGVDDYVTLSATSNIINSSTMSWEFILYPVSLSGYRGILGNTSFAGPYIAFHLSTGSDVLRIEAADDTGYPGIGHWIDTTTGVTVPNNVYTIISITYDGSNFRIYKNGVLETTIAYIYGFGTNSNILYIGQFWAGFWNGRIASTKIYNKTLSATEVLQNYTAQKSRFGL